MDEIEKLWNHGERGDVALAEGAQQFGGIERFQINHASSDDQREQKVGHLGEHME